MRWLVFWIVACSGEGKGTTESTPVDTDTPVQPVDTGGTTEPEVVTFVVSPEEGDLGVREPVVVVFDAQMDPSTAKLGGTLLATAASGVTWSSANTRLELAPTTTWTASPTHTVALAVDSARGTPVEVDATWAVSTQIAFVTSQRGSGDLGSWSAAGGATGREAGDAICASEAAGAGLTGEFRALLSDGAHDAACTLYGLDGEMSQSCGVYALPDPLTWQRPDGLPLGDSAQLVDGFMSNPLNTPLTFGSVSGTWYGTRPLNCGDWTRGDAGATGRIHTPFDTRLKPAVDARAFNAPTCDTEYQLMCLQMSESVPLTPPVEDGLRVFVSSASGTGDLGSWPEAGGATGIAAGDAVCQGLATEAGLDRPTAFRALLSDPTVDAADRFAADGPYVRLDGALLGPTFLEMLSPATSRPLDETGAPIQADPLEWFHRVWTGTGPHGRANGNDQCASWTDGTFDLFTAFGSYAMAGSWGTQWSGTIACGNDAHLYCVELPAGRY